ncbi:MAG: Uma2 family endonuclease [Methylococcales bacterium]|nr:Uma2 family endonuclease [Methylococcales bacterium]
MQLTLEQLCIPQGQQLLLKDISWQMFETIQDEFEKAGRKSRFSYSKGWLELMSPLAVHEFDKIIISDFVKALLEEQEIEFIDLGSVTLRSKRAKKAVEPDACFYIQHEAKIRGKDKIHLDIDPAPDLAIEIDITYRSHFDNYEKLGVPELWRFDGQILKIFLLEKGCYQESDISLQFPQLSIKQLIPDYLEQCKKNGRNKTMRAFRQMIVENLVLKKSEL